MLKKFCTTIVLLLMLGFFCSCRSTPFEYADMEELSGDFKLKKYELAPWKQIALQFRMVIEYPFYSVSVVCMMQASGEKMIIAAMLPAGVKFMEISGTAGEVEKYFFMPGFIEDKKQQQEFAAALLKDFKRIFLNERFLYPGVPAGAEAERTAKGIKIVLPERGEKRFYGSKQLRLMKKSVKNEQCYWQSEYFRCNVSGDFVYPEQIVYKNKKDGYRLILRVYDFQAN